MDDSFRYEQCLKQIEAEINAGYAFVAAARKAYQSSLADKGDAALDQALSQHAKALRQIGQSSSAHVRSISEQISELREVIDWLRLLHCADTAK